MPNWLYYVVVAFIVVVGAWSVLTMTASVLVNTESYKADQMSR